MYDFMVVATGRGSPLGIHTACSLHNTLPEALAEIRWVFAKKEPEKDFWIENWKTGTKHNSKGELIEPST